MSVARVWSIESLDRETQLACEPFELVMRHNGTCRDVSESKNTSIIFSAVHAYYLRNEQLRRTTAHVDYSERNRILALQPLRGAFAGMFAAVADGVGTEISVEIISAGATVATMFSWLQLELELPEVGVSSADTVVWSEVS